MAQFEAFEEGIEVNGQTIFSVIEGIKSKKWIGYKILDENGIIDPQPGSWYSQANWLKSFKDIVKELGEDILYQIGRNIPETADWPPNVKNIHEALASIDIAYHINHRKNGKILLDSKTGTMEEGIGHYQYEKLEERKAKMTCRNPYPCDFDKGIIEATAYKFKGADDNIQVSHEESSCRKKDRDTCVYIVTW